MRACAASSINDKAVLLGKHHEFGHIARHSGVVDGNNCTGPRRNRASHFFRVEIERVGPDICEHRCSPAQRDGVGARYECERRHDRFVARTEFSKQRREFEACCRRMRQVSARGIHLCCKPGLAAMRECAIARKMALLNCFAQILKLTSDNSGLAETYFHCPRRLHGSFA